MKIITDPRRFVVIVLAAALFVAAPAESAAQYAIPGEALVAKFRKDYPAKMTLTQVGELVARVAEALGPDWGVLLKTGGTRCPSVVGTISCDILVHIPQEQEYDILVNADGEPGKPQATPAWNALRDRDTGKLVKCGTPGKSGCNMARVRRVAAVPTTPPPAPEPVPAPTPAPADPTGITHEDLADDLLQLGLTLEALETSLIGRLAALEARVETAAAAALSAAQLAADIKSIVSVGTGVPGALPPYKGTARLGWWTVDVISEPCPECRR